MIQSRDIKQQAIFTFNWALTQKLRCDQTLLQLCFNCMNALFIFRIGGNVRGHFYKIYGIYRCLWNENCIVWKKVPIHSRKLLNRSYFGCTFLYQNIGIMRYCDNAWFKSIRTKSLHLIVTSATFIAFSFHSKLSVNWMARATGVITF